MDAIDIRWQPVATAPKDGTHVDLWFEVGASPRSMGFGDSFRVVDAWCKNGKWVHMDGMRERELYADYITHWMPIPEGPATELARLEGEGGK